MKIQTLILCFAFLSFTGWAEYPEPVGEVIFSVVTLEGAFTGIQTNKTGFYFYYQEDDSDSAGPYITGYHFKAGEIVDVFGGGTYGSARILEQLKTISISSFDFEEEIKKAYKQQEKESNKTGTPYERVITLDGAKFRIYYSFAGATVSYTAWNPGPEINLLSNFNENIHQFSKVIDVFANYYGKTKFGL